MENKKIWFRRKIYGWGWYPASWEGWLVIFIWLLVFIPIVNLIKQQSLLSFILIFISVIILISICYLKGETPKWQWGNGSYHPTPFIHGLQIFLLFPIIIGIWMIFNQSLWVPTVVHYIINNWL